MAQTWADLGSGQHKLVDHFYQSKFTTFIIEFITVMKMYYCEENLS